MIGRKLILIRTILIFLIASGFPVLQANADQAPVSPVVASIPPSTPATPPNSSLHALTQPPPSIPSPPPPLIQPDATPPSPSPPTKKSDSAIVDKSGPPENSSPCSSASSKCSVEGLIACLKNESEGWFLVLHNNRTDDLNLTITARPPVISESSILVPKQNQSKVKLKKGSDDNVSIELKTGDQMCILGMRSVQPTAEMVGPFQYGIPHVTPLYGVYAACLSILLVGGVWMCCKFRKKTGGGAGPAYQQLEMGSGLPPGTVTGDHRMEGWDEHWSEGWDEEEAQPRAPEGKGTAAARSSSDRNDWEDWDD